MTNELEAARLLAVRAGAILLEHYSGSRLDVRWKGSDPVTEADRSASEFLTRELKRMFPEDGILSEEEPDNEDRLSRSRVWIIDPLDGTMEFINHVDEFAVMIALAVEGKGDLGIVYQPVTEKLYYASRDSGAFLIENRRTRLLQASRESNPSAMTMAVSRSHRSSSLDRIQRELGIANTLCSGSMGLKVGLICEGRAHVYVDVSGRTSHWDACAPDVILREAGGRMTDIWNDVLRYNTRDVRNVRGVVASNGTIHERVTAATKRLPALKL
jgi:3'(2'), 5'-bisphosphate nucleotidase